MDQEAAVVYGDLFSLFTKELYGPEPGETIDQEGLRETLEGLDLNPEDQYINRQFRRWWGYYGGSLQEDVLV